MVIECVCAHSEMLNKNNRWRTHFPGRNNDLNAHVCTMARSSVVVLYYTLLRIQLDLRIYRHFHPIGPLVAPAWLCYVCMLGYILPNLFMYCGKHEYRIRVYRGLEQSLRVA